jgi:hypothetical protein
MRSRTVSTSTELTRAPTVVILDLSSLQGSKSKIIAPRGRSRAQAFFLDAFWPFLLVLSKLG